MQKVSLMSERRGDLEQILDGDLQRQLDELADRVAANRADIDVLAHRVAASDARHDGAEARLSLLEASAAMDIELIAELGAEWELGRERAAQLEKTLQSSRMIAAAIGIVMADRKVTPAQAFETLTVASQNANRKLREVAADVVETGDVSDLRNT
jgi:hypothetical protein